MNCPDCQRENRADARFCDSCGGPLVRSCPGCERELRSDAAFCDSCGLRIGGIGSSAAGATVASTDAIAQQKREDAPSSTSGRFLAGGRYELVRFLGEGAKKRVHLARDTRLDRDVAIAFVKSEGLDMARVRREARNGGIYLPIQRCLSESHLSDIVNSPLELPIFTER